MRTLARVVVVPVIIGAGTAFLSINAAWIVATFRVLSKVLGR